MIRALRLKQGRRSMVQWGAALAALLFLMALWRFTPLAEFIEPRVLFKWMRAFAHENQFAFLVFAIAIGVGNVLLVPINVLLVAVAMVFPGWKGFACGMLGAWVACSIEYSLGRVWGAAKAEAAFGDRFRIVTDEVREQGLPALIMLCLVPVAPNIVINTVAGICRIAWWKVLIAVTIGFIPGLTVLNLLGREMRRFLKEPSVSAAIGAGVIVLFMIGATFLTKRMKKKIEAKHAARSTNQIRFGQGGSPSCVDA